MMTDKDVPQSTIFFGNMLYLYLYLYHFVWEIYKARTQGIRGAHKEYVVLYRAPRIPCVRAIFIHIAPVILTRVL